MGTILLTHAVVDNERSDVDFAAQDLRDEGLHVRLVRWTPRTGAPLWNEVESTLLALEPASAWVHYVTPNSLGSTLCREDVADAIRRVRRARGEEYRVIGLLPAPAFQDLLAAVPGIALAVDLTAPGWRNEVRSIVEGSAPTAKRPRISPFDIHVNRIDQDGRYGYAIEIRPRAGSWSPFFAAIPNDELEALRPRLLHGPRGRIPAAAMLDAAGEGQLGPLWRMWAHNAASPTESYFLLCQGLPTKLIFGVHRGQPQYEVTFQSGAAPS